MSKKPGHTVEVILNVYDGDELISQTDTDWYGLDRGMANVMSRDLVQRLLKATEDWEKQRAGGTPPVEERGRR